MGDGTMARINDKNISGLINDLFDKYAQLVRRLFSICVKMVKMVMVIFHELQAYNY